MVGFDGEAALRALAYPRRRQMLAMLPRLRDQGHNIVLVEQNATLTSVTTVMSGGSTLASDPNEVAWHRCSS